MNRAAAWRSWLASLLPALIVFVAARALAPPAPNGDGLGYLKASVSGADYPGHVGYVPLLRGLRRAFGAGPRAIDGLDIARGSSAACAACAVLLLGRLLRAPAGRSLVASAGFAASNACFMAAADVESYAPALACMLAALVSAEQRARGGGRGWTFATAAAWALATALHAEHLLLGIALCVLLPARDRWLALALGGASIAAAYAPALVQHGARWLAAASHGFRYPLRAHLPLAALYGAAKALVHAPYPYEASWCAVLAPTLVGSGVLACGIAIGRTERPRSLVLAWLVPYALIGLIYFPSEQERWLFVLPLFWLHAARARRVAMLAALVAIVLAADVCWLAPELRDSRLRDQAVRASRALQPGDLVVGPGHGWDEYVGFFAGPEVEPFPLVHHAAAGGSRAALRERLDLAVRAARARGGRVLLARLDDRADPRGWKELAAFDVTPENVRLVLPAGVWHDLGDGLAELIAAP